MFVFGFSHCWVFVSLFIGEFLDSWFYTKHYSIWNSLSPEIKWTYGIVRDAELLQLRLIFGLENDWYMYIWGCPSEIYHISLKQVIICCWVYSRTLNKLVWVMRMIRGLWVNYGVMLNNKEQELQLLFEGSKIGSITGVRGFRKVVGSGWKTLVLGVLLFRDLGEENDNLSKESQIFVCLQGWRIEDGWIWSKLLTKFSLGVDV